MSKTINTLPTSTLLEAQTKLEEIRSLLWPIKIPYCDMDGEVQKAISQIETAKSYLRYLVLSRRVKGVHE